MYKLDYTIDNALFGGSDGSSGGHSRTLLFALAQIFFVEQIGHRYRFVRPLTAPSKG